MQHVPDFSKNWLRHFAAAVRARDFASGGKMFDGDVISFGTVCFRVENLDELAQQQWRLIWLNTTDFDFEYDSARAVVDENLAAVIATWKSTGYDRKQKPFERRGRATIVLRKGRSGWKAIHTHFSLSPVCA